MIRVSSLICRSGVHWIHLKMMIGSKLSDYIIEIVGYKGTEARVEQIRSSLFRFLMNHFIENIDHIFIPHGCGIHYTTCSHGKLKMKRDSFKMGLMKSHTQHSHKIYRNVIAFENHVKSIQYINMNVSDIRKNSRLQKILKKLHNSKPKHQYHRHTHNHHWTNINRIAFFKNRIDNPKSRKIWMNSTLVRNDDINYLVHTAKKYNADTLEQQYMHRYTIIHKKNDYTIKNANTL